MEVECWMSRGREFQWWGGWATEGSWPHGNQVCRWEDELDGRKGSERTGGCVDMAELGEIHRSKMTDGLEYKEELSCWLCGFLWGASGVAAGQVLCDWCRRFLWWYGLQEFCILTSKYAGVTRLSKLRKALWTRELCGKCAHAVLMSAVTQFQPIIAEWWRISRT